MKDTFYITSAIYYVNDVPHVGHTYEIVCCDAIARFHRMLGEKVFFLSGSDEHSQNVAKAGAERGLTPQAWTDEIVPIWQDVWRSLDISNDDWLRTSEARHVEGVQKFVNVLYERGDVYEGSYEGPYCVSCEEFKVENELIDGKCPIHKIPVQRLTEANYFFRLSKYQDALLRLYEENPGFIEPEIRRNEVVSFVRSGLRDLSISRAEAVWGVPVPWDPKHVIYVWVDALLNYITAPGFGADPERFGSIWPADVHLIGKDITRFHAVIWPAMLMCAGLPLPERVFAHGWLSYGGERMSKSLGTGVPPAEVLERYGVDAYRYYLLREVQFGADGNFTWEGLAARYTSELANGVGNLASRVLAMAGNYFDGQVPEPSSREGLGMLPGPARGFVQRFERGFLDLDLSDAMSALDDLVREANRYLVQVGPWLIAKDPARRQELADSLYEALEALRLWDVLAYPIMPSAAARLWEQLGMPEPLADQRLPEAASWGLIEPGTKTNKGESLFPRLEG